MSKVFIEESTLTSICDSIRTKGGTTDPIKVSDIPSTISNLPSGGGDLPAEALTISGDCYYRFSNNGWNWFIEKYGDKITTKDITVVNSMFHGSDKITKVPFDLNLSSGRSYHDSSYIFENCNNLTQLPKLNNVIVYDTRGMFRFCNNLRIIPQDIADTWDWSYLEKQTSSSIGK